MEGYRHRGLNIPLCPTGRSSIAHDGLLAIFILESQNLLRARLDEGPCEWGLGGI